MVVPIGTWHCSLITAIAPCNSYILRTGWIIRATRKEVGFPRRSAKHWMPSQNYESIKCVSIFLLEIFVDLHEIWDYFSNFVKCTKRKNNFGKNMMAILVLRILPGNEIIRELLFIFSKIYASTKTGYYGGCCDCQARQSVYQPPQTCPAWKIYSHSILNQGTTVINGIHIEILGGFFFLWINIM